ncbi:VQ motif-containing protein [Perilla frutescens var. hirtella]|uniref:VQ motif-containing protein n=1 Tax=Perilla frutescens var. hirtella TaxID=608512 RepID=A0AAD4IQ53_PERFH|nr:VQ motif-containing protein [Perilla frutescens var. hirtella]KAH6782384.1 VQ motif-containing protein [Perilla frutescens var. frutescens]KAH6800297.1 VQ motif-containing protein [Perilla frutescens var. hirtella]
MDSGNSGSMQSSSGGDDQDFDSRGESISSFLNAPHHFGSISAAAPQQPFLSHQNPNFFVDPHHQLAQNLDHGGGHYTNDNDLIWSRGLRSDHSFSNLGNSSSSSLPTSRPHQPIPTAPFPGPSSADGHASRAPPPQPNAIKNPKKRTRASRRAPTTVLTTDTTNFRQMVQEFTGIPAAPFSGSPYSRRLDLFSAASALRSASHLDTLGPLYPLRPAAHKILSPFSSSTPPSLLNPTMIDAIVPTTTITNTNNNSNNLGASTSNNPNSFQLSGDHHHHLLSIQQHGIQQPPSLQVGANAPMDFANLSSFLSRDGASAAAVQVRGNDDDLSRWKSGETVRNNDGVQENLVEFDGNNINSGESQNYNLNLADKGMENVASSAAEGTVASWICSSD